MTPPEALHRLLCSVFHPRELVWFLRNGPEGKRLVQELPGDAAPFSQLAAEAVKRLEAYKLVDDAFFDRLSQELPPTLAEDIRAVRESWRTGSYSSPPALELSAWPDSVFVVNRTMSIRRPVRCDLGGWVAELLTCILTELDLPRDHVEHGFGMRFRYGLRHMGGPLSEEQKLRDAGVRSGALLILTVRAIPVLPSREESLDEYRSPRGIRGIRAATKAAEHALDEALIRSERIRAG